MKQRIVGFDIARVLSMLYIIAVYHILGYTSILYHNSLVLALVNSTLGTFTFLSSFLISSRYNFNDKGNILFYYKKRVIRIYPLFFITSIILLLMGFNDLPKTIKGLLGISPLWGPHPRTMWYIAMLLLFYIVTPLLARGKLLKKTISYIIVNVIFVLISLVLYHINPATFFYFAIYFIGVVLGSQFYDKVINILKSPKSLFISILSLFLLLVNVYFDNNIYRFFSGFCGVFMILNISYILGDKASKNSRFISVIGLASYASMCAYLFHRECYEIMLKVYYPENPYMVLTYLFFIGVPLVLILSYYIQKLYDSIVNKYEKS